jgi:hypothetical protein
MVEFPWAFNRKGDPIHIDDAKKDSDGPFSCPDCTEELVARQGPKRTWHFAHKADSACRGESAEHKIAKRLLCVHLRKWSFQVTCRRCRRVSKCVFDDPKATAKEEVTWQKDFRLDVAVLDESQTVVGAIEVCYKHPNDPLKWHAFAESSTARQMIEVQAVDIISAYTTQQWDVAAVNQCHRMYCKDHPEVGDCPSYPCPKCHEEARRRDERLIQADQRALSISSDVFPVFRPTPRVAADVVVQPMMDVKEPEVSQPIKKRIYLKEYIRCSKEGKALEARGAKWDAAALQFFVYETDAAAFAGLTTDIIPSTFGHDGVFNLPPP